jgi:hypothetical protein
LTKSKEKMQRPYEENHLFWFPFHVNEWLASRAVRFMKDYEKGWYISLLVESWPQAGTLPDDRDLLWKMAGAQSQEFFERHGSGVLSEFERCEIDGTPCLISPRLAALYAKQDNKYRKQVEAGRISADRRAARIAQNATTQSENETISESASVQ